MHEVCPFVLTSAGVENSKGITWAKGVPFSFHMFPYTWVRISFKAIMSYYTLPKAPLFNTPFSTLLSLTIQKLLTVQYLTNRGSHLKIGIKPNGPEALVSYLQEIDGHMVITCQNLDRCDTHDSRFGADSGLQWTSYHCTNNLGPDKMEPVCGDCARARDQEHKVLGRARKTGTPRIIPLPSSRRHGNIDSHLFQYVCTELLDEQCTLQVLVTGIV